MRSGMSSGRAEMVVLTQSKDSMVVVVVDMMWVAVESEGLSGVEMNHDQRGWK